MHLLKRFWPLLIIFCIEMLLFLTNYRPATYLAGWDGLYPELNFSVNFQRNIFSVWQEYRGVGLYDGMSHASNLLHTLFLWLLHIFLPQDILRYFFIFLMHALGVIGMYMLLQHLVKNRLVALFGSLFYGFNLGITQMFYTPLEVFAIHFAFLPFLAWSLLAYLQTPTRKKIIPFFIFSLLSTPQGFVPQIFICYLLLVASILGVYLHQYGKAAFQATTNILIVIFCVNAFWLLPYIYGLPQNAPVIMNSKINQMASNKIYLMNKTRGNLADVLTMKGFMLDGAEFVNQEYGYIMPQWRNHTTSLFFIIPSLIFITLLLFGIYTIRKTKQIEFYPFVISFGLSFFFLGNDIWGLSLLNSFLRWLLPIFNEAFRFPFTKFSTLFAFSYTIVLAVGVQEIIKKINGETVHIFAFSKVTEKITNSFLDYIPYRKIFRLSSDWKKENRYVKSLGIIIAYSLLPIALLLYSFPVFQGHFLFDALRVKMEPEYMDVIRFLDNQPTPARIATLPQPTFYNWEYHQNNYRGSGFVWYGIPQATLERSFDPWSNINENYYWELSQALYSHNTQALHKVFAKYQVTYILLDENRIYPFAPKSLQIQETKAMVTNSGAQEIKQFGKITLYRLPASPLFTATNLPTVNPYQWGDTDVFYQLHGNYIATDRANFTLPFRSLFTNKTQKSLPFRIEKNAQEISFTTNLDAYTSHITLPSFTAVESLIPGKLIYSPTTKIISLLVQTPQTFIAGQNISNQSLIYPLFRLPDNPAFPLHIQINGQYNFTLLSNPSQTLGTVLLPVSQNTIVIATDQQRGTAEAILPKEKIQETFSHPVSISLAKSNKVLPLTVKISTSPDTFLPNIQTIAANNCNTLAQGTIQLAQTKERLDKTQNIGISLSALHADACLSFLDRAAQSSEGYLLSLTSRHITGEPLTLWAEDSSEEYTFLYTQLPIDSNEAISYFMVPTRENFNLGYTFHVENISTGNDASENELQSLSLSPIPSQFLTHILADTGKNQSATSTEDVSFTHPNPSMYSIDTSGLPENATIVLSQAFDPGWHAYFIPNTTFHQILHTIFPFFGGEELKDHVKVNNWENGWVLPNNELPTTNHGHVIILFLPQYLEYLGFGILGLSIVILLLQNMRYGKRN